MLAPDENEPESFASWVVLLVVQDRLLDPLISQPESNRCRAESLEIGQTT